MCDFYDYTFVVCTYNQQDLIIQALESIKYQVVTYAKENDTIQLVISDDGSSDRNVEVIERWLESNEQCFTKVDRLFHKVHQGTCHNFCDALEVVRGRTFKEMAGDDLLPVNNVFEIMDRLGEEDIVAGVVLKFEDDKVIDNKKRYVDVLRQAFLQYDQVRALSKTSVPVQGGVFWRRNLNTKEVLDYVRQFRLVEDRPLWYKITQANENLNYYFERNVVLLYREGGGHNPRSSVYSIHMQDIRRLREDVRRDKLSLVERESLFCWVHHLKYLNLSIYKVKLIDFLHRKQIIHLWEEAFLSNIERNRRHIVNMAKISEEFYKREGFHE